MRTIWSAFSDLLGGWEYRGEEPAAQAPAPLLYCNRELSWLKFNERVKIRKALA